MNLPRAFWIAQQEAKCLRRLRCKNRFQFAALLRGLERDGALIEYAVVFPGSAAGAEDITISTLLAHKKYAAKLPDNQCVAEQQPVECMMVS
jgi:hypothetical protein